MMKLVCQTPTYVCHRSLPSITRNQLGFTAHKSRRVVFLSAVTLSFSSLVLSNGPTWSIPNPEVPKFLELPNSGGVKALDLRIGDGDSPLQGDVGRKNSSQLRVSLRVPKRRRSLMVLKQWRSYALKFVAIHYYGRLAAKHGWRFDSTYDHKDETGEPIPFSFILGSGKVISWIETCVESMKVGGLRRVIIPPSQGYQNTSQEPLPPNYFDRQRFFTTIFNPTRLANGEGSTLGTLIFDIELVCLRHH